MVFTDGARSAPRRPQRPASRALQVTDDDSLVVGVGIGVLPIPERNRHPEAAPPGSPARCS